MPTYTAFAGTRRIATGAAAEIARALRSDEPVLVFHDDTGAQVDLDLRGTPEEIARRYPVAEPSAEDEAPPPRTGPGRPRLGVVSREVSLLPRHWGWLSTQPGGASAALRRLVDQARRERQVEDAARESRDAAYRFMLAMAGNLPGFEEASRALFGMDLEALDAIMAGWPVDVREHTRRLLLPAARGLAASTGILAP